jgi:hypothetical protein
MYLHDRVQMRWVEQLARSTGPAFIYRLNAHIVYMHTGISCISVYTVVCAAGGRHAGCIEMFKVKRDARGSTFSDLIVVVEFIDRRPGSWRLQDIHMVMRTQLRQYNAIYVAFHAIDNGLRSRHSAWPDNRLS